MKNLLINLSVKPIWATFFKIKEIIKNCKKSWGEHLTKADFIYPYAN